MNATQLLRHSDFTFRRRPFYVPAHLRLSYRVGEILVLLGCASRRGRSSIARLHILNSAIRASSSPSEVAGWISHDSVERNLPLRVEPGLTRVLRISESLRLIETVKGKSFQLTNAGTLHLNAILALGPTPYARLRQLSPHLKRITEGFTSSIISPRRGA